MRVLVEQTVRNAGRWLDAAATAFAGNDQGPPSLHVLMGGQFEDDWVNRPGESAILVGTQDMLLSRALMRGYGASRYHWPISFALLHNDSLWVFDEVQLMGVGLATSAQLDGSRRHSETTPMLPSRSLWMSAIFDRSQLDTIDLRPHLVGLEFSTLEEDDRAVPVAASRRAAAKHFERAQTRLTVDNCRSDFADYASTLAAEIVATHCRGTSTLVVVNRVDRAQAVYRALTDAACANDIERLLIHSRFREGDRRQREAASREEPASAGGRIVIATQAIEAGVDVSSTTMFTELAA